MKLGHTAFLRIFALVGFGAVFLTATSVSADVVTKNAKTTSSLSFTAQCPELLKQADDFANDCLAHAREQVRYFHPAGPTPGSYGEGIKEARKVYFQEARPGSHFSLGCAVDSGLNEIYFLGVYYAAKDSNFKAANSAPFRYIDSRGDVGIWVDDNPVNLLAVRQFDTKGHPLTNWKKDRIKNCENADLPSDEVRSSYETVWITTIPATDPTFKTCHSSPQTKDRSCEIRTYFDFFSTPDHHILYDVGAFLSLVTDGGDLLVSRDWYQTVCWPIENRKRDKPNIVQEICDLPAQ